MIKSMIMPTIGRFGATFALLGALLWLAACQPVNSVTPADSQVRADSTTTMDDPPVKPDGPGGGK